ncbi:hypothetical protein ACH3XW_25675 [Acanthocheilonema viteae]
MRDITFTHKDRDNRSLSQNERVFGGVGGCDFLSVFAALYCRLVFDLLKTCGLMKCLFKKIFKDLESVLFGRTCFLY